MRSPCSIQADIADIPLFVPKFGTCISVSLFRTPLNFHVFIDLKNIEPEECLTALFSSTHPEHFFCPFVFNDSSRATFIFNIFFVLPLCFQQLIRIVVKPFIMCKLPPHFFTFTRMPPGDCPLPPAYRLSRLAGTRKRRSLPTAYCSGAHITCQVFSCRISYR